MAIPTTAGSSAASRKDKIIVALDVDKASAAKSIVRELEGLVGAFKIGLQLFTSEGPHFVNELTDSGAKIFLDLKFHDIPNTVAKAAVAASKLGVWMFNVHASGGSEMMKRAVLDVQEACGKDTLRRPLIIAVTVLTSVDDGELEEIGVGTNVAAQVGTLAKLAASCGLDGVVASPFEVGIVRREVLNPTFLTVTPGIRSSLATLDDQKRVTTLGQALANGSDYVVIGRPIIKARDRAAAVQEILREIE